MSSLSSWESLMLQASLANEDCMSFKNQLFRSKKKVQDLFCKALWTALCKV